MRTRTVDLDRLIREIILEYPDLQSQSNHITIQGKLPKVLGYAPGLAQVAANLLGNGLHGLEIVIGGGGEVSLDYVDAELGELLDYVEFFLGG